MPSLYLVWSVVHIVCGQLVLYLGKTSRLFIGLANGQEPYGCVLLEVGVI